MDNRAEAREFLASRRARITPEQAGIEPYGGRRRVPGLRREEVARLGGVSIDYYTRLERGNLTGASEQELSEHPAIMSRYSNGSTKKGPVTAVVSGNRPLATMQAQDKRFAFFDGRSSDLTSGMPAGLMPLVSENWTRLFSWQGIGPMPELERAKLRAYVKTAHTEGYRVRFWATPDQEGPVRDAMWTELYEAGVDHINTDDLPALQAFLSSRN